MPIRANEAINIVDLIVGDRFTNWRDVVCVYAGLWWSYQTLLTLLTHCYFNSPSCGWLHVPWKRSLVFHVYALPQSRHIHCYTHRQDTYIRYIVDQHPPLA